MDADDLQPARAQHNAFAGPQAFRYYAIRSILISIVIDACWKARRHKPVRTTR